MKKTSALQCLRFGMYAMLAALLFCITFNVLAALHVVPQLWAFLSHGAFLLCTVAYAVVVFRHRHHPGEEEEGEALATAAERLLRLGVMLLVVLILWLASLTAAVYMGGM